MGKSFYNDDSFGLAATHFEKALEEYFTSSKECRALCEGRYHFDGYTYMEYNADLFQAMTGEARDTELKSIHCSNASCSSYKCDCFSDHYMQLLNCKQHCSVELASAAGRDGPFEDFLPSHFNYLQFSYYNSKCISLFLIILCTPYVVVK